MGRSQSENGQSLGKFHRGMPADLHEPGGRFVDAMLAIREEIRAIEEGRMDRNDNPLRNAPHTAAALLTTEWKHGYSREQAAYPLASLKANKIWPSVGRADNVYGDRNLFCACVPVAEYA